jgi:hypothetical protein
MKTIKTILAASALLAAGFSGVASAHPYPGALKTPATATDKFYIVCYAGAASVSYAITKTAGTGGVKISGPAGTTTNGGKTLSYATGAGAKSFTVSKNPAASGAVSYTAQIHCYDANGQHNPDDQSATQTYTQNQ